MKKGKYQKKKRKSFALPILIVALVLACSATVFFVWNTVVDGNKNAPAIVAPDVESAIEQLAKMGEEFGYRNALSELTALNTTELDGDTFYRLQQNYQGIPVYGRSVVCATNQAGEQISLTGNPFDIGENISLTPTVEFEQVQMSIDEYAEDVLGINDTEEVYCFPLSEDMLCIFSSEQYNQGVLAYRVFVTVSYGECGSVPYEAIVDAQTGKTLQMSCLIAANSVTLPIQSKTGKRVSVDVECVSEEGVQYYQLIDPTRRIRIFDADNHLLEYELYENNELVRTREGETLREFSAGNATLKLYSNPWYAPPVELTVPDKARVEDGIQGFDTSAVRLMSGLQIAYDYFGEMFGLNGIGKDGQWINGVHDNSSSMYYNAYCWGLSVYAMYMDDVVISFSSLMDPAIDTVAHEYAHGVEGCRSKMVYEGESGAIKEALSDIFGELVEDWYLQKTGQGNCDWEIVNRNIAKPESSGNPSFYLGKKWKNTDKLKDDHGGVHTNNTVLSHAAYLMWSGIDGSNNKRLPTEELAKLWYRAMLMMPSDCTFMECRNLVILAAETMGWSKARLECVSEAFDLVGLTNDVQVDYPVAEGATLTVYQSDGTPCNDYNLHITSTKSGSDAHGNMIKKSSEKDISVHTDGPFDVGFELGGHYAITLSSGENTKMTPMTFTVGTKVGSLKDNLDIFTDATAPETEEKSHAYPTSITAYSNGKVSEEYFFTYNELNQVSNVAAFRCEGGQMLVWYNESFTFDAKGNVVLVEHQGEQTFTYSYQYDADNRMIDCWSKEFYNGIAGPSEHTLFEYDPQGRVSKLKTDTNGASEMTLSYDDLGKIVYETGGGKYGDMSFSTKAQYDYSNYPLVIQKNITSYTGVGESETTSISFMPNWNLSLASVVLEEGYSLDYNDNGDLAYVYDRRGDKLYSCDYQGKNDVGATTDVSNDIISFADIPENFIFTSGAGGWATQMKLNADGSFTGEYHNSDLGISSDEYPHGTVYICCFSGKFSTLTPVDDQVYTTTLTTLETEGNAGEAYIKDGTQYIVSDPFGFDNAEQFFVYLPETPTRAIPEECVQWVKRLYNFERHTPTGVYIFYNANGEEPFVGTKD